MLHRAMTSDGNTTLAATDSSVQVFILSDLSKRRSREGSFGGR
jgi:hypothetical protein